MALQFETSSSVSGCVGCSLSGKTKVLIENVPGANILLIGEAPGTTEVEQGKPFIGKSGEILRKIIKNLGLVCSITNTVKCRPPNNAKPDGVLTRRCATLYLEKEIELLQPKVIVCLGRTPEQFFFKKRIKRNEVLNWNGRRVISVYHPAAILHQGGMGSPAGRKIYKELIEGLSLARRVADEREAPRNIHVIRDDDEVESVMLSREWPVAAFDIEATCLEVWSEDFLVRTIAFSDGVDSYSFEWNERNKEVARKVFEMAGKIIPYNAQFDVMALYKEGIDLRDKNVHDVMLISYILDENRRDRGLNYSLKSLVKELLCEYQVLVKDFVSVRLSELLHYNAEDALYTAQLFLKLMPQLEEEEGLLWVYSNILMPAVSVLFMMTYTGWKLNQEEVRKIDRQLRDELGVLSRKLSKLIGGSPTSPLVLRKYFYDMQKYPVFKRTPKTKLPSTDASVIGEFAKKGDPVAKSILVVKKKTKLHSTYVEPYIKFEDTVHGSFVQHHTVSGRLASEDPNLQNIPRGPQIKNFFISRDGYILAQGDLSQAELRVGCSLANERKMIAVYSAGQDIHIATASLVFGVSMSAVTKEQRQICKSVNFGLLYGQGADGFRRYLLNKANLDVSLRQATGWRNSFFKAYPDLRPWYARVREELRETKQVVSPFGRRRRFPDLDLNDEEGFAAVFRMAVNAPVQGSSSDINTMAAITLDRRIRKGGLEDEIHLLSMVHDNIIMEMKEKHLPWVMKLVDISINQYDWLRVPMVMDWEVGTCWGQLKKVG